MRFTQSNDGKRRTNLRVELRLTEEDVESIMHFATCDGEPWRQWLTNRCYDGLFKRLFSEDKPELVRKHSSRYVMGYCALCRAYELRHYGELQDENPSEHKVACRLAGCNHPPVYHFRKKKGTT